MSNSEKEFQTALQEIAHFAPSLNSPFGRVSELRNLGCNLDTSLPLHVTEFTDRVRLAEWIRSLCLQAEQYDQLCTLVNPYAQLLRIQVRVGYLQSPFLTPPSSGNIPPLAVCLVRV